MRRLTFALALAFALLVPTGVFAQSSRDAWLHARENTDRALEQARAASVAPTEARQSDRRIQADTITSGLPVTSWRIFADSDGFAVVVGEMQNLTGVTLTFPKAIVDFANGGTYLGTYYNYAFGSQVGRVAATGTYTNILPAGAFGFFKVPTLLNYADITTFSFTTEAETFALSPVFASVQLGPVGLGANGRDFAGTLRNASGNFTTFFTQVAVAGYLNGVINDVSFTDVSGATIAICGTTSTSAVFPGATVSFSGSFDTPVSEIHRTAVEWDEYGIVPAAQTFAGSGGSGSVAFVGNCAWDAVSNVPWITITGSASGTGDATISFVVAPNAQGTRSGTMTIAGQTFTVTQGNTSCTYGVDFPFTTVAALGASGVATVTAAGGCAWTASSSAPWATFAAAGGTGSGSIGISVAPNPTSLPRSATMSIAGQLFTINQLRSSGAGDFDGDGKAEISVFRPSNGTWYVRYTGTPTTDALVWGGGDDVPVPGDYDGDGLVDIAVFRPSTGTWYVRYTATATSAALVWGGAGDVPVPADYDGDGKTDIAVFRPSTGTWYVRYTGTATSAALVWGGGGDVPTPADYDGDGKADIAVFRPSDGTWYIRYTGTPTSAALVWGGDGDQPVPVDFDGDGKAEIAVFRPSTGTWYIRYTATPTTVALVWGGGGDVPVPGDFDGDGQADIAVFRPSTGTWYIRYTATPTSAALVWGGDGDIPILKRP